MDWAIGVLVSGVVSPYSSPTRIVILPVIAARVGVTITTRSTIFSFSTSTTTCFSISTGFSTTTSFSTTSLTMTVSFTTTGTSTVFSTICGSQAARIGRAAAAPKPAKNERRVNLLDRNFASIGNSPPYSLMRLNG